MLTVIIAIDKNSDALPDTLAMLVSGVVFGVVNEVILVDEAHSENIEKIADDTGCRYISHNTTPPNTTKQDTLTSAITTARGQWLLFLPCGARLLDQWKEIIARHIETQQKAAKFMPIPTNAKNIFQRFFVKKPLFADGLLIQKNALKNDIQLKSLSKIKTTLLPIQIFLPN